MAEPIVSDADLLFTSQQKLLKAETRVEYFKICTDEGNGGKLMSIQLGLANSQRKDWLNVIGNAENAKKSKCKVVAPISDKQDYVPIYITIGYVANEGVNYF